MRRSVHRGILELYPDLSLRLLARGRTIPHICLMFYGQHKGALNPCPKPLEQGHGGNTVFRIWVVTFYVCLIANAIKKTWINRVYGRILPGNPIFYFITVIRVCQWATMVDFIITDRFTVMYFKSVSHKMHIYPKVTMVPDRNALHPKLYVTCFMTMCIFNGLQTWCRASNTFRSLSFLSDHAWHLISFCD